jgi:hypothetical protein
VDLGKIIEVIQEMDSGGGNFKIYFEIEISIHTHIS